MNLSKTKKVLLIILSILISISIIMIVYNKVKYLSNQDKYIINKESVEKVISEAKPIKDYNTFYTLNSACKNYTNYLLSKDYSKTYEIFSTKLKTEVSAIEYTKKIREFTEKYLFSKNLDNLYDVENSLYKAFVYNELEGVSSVYLCQIKTLEKDKYLNIAIRLITSGKPRYEILYVGV